MPVPPRASRTRNDLLGACAAGLIVIVFCLVLFWHDPQVFWVDDYQISILPVFADVARSWSEGHWPLLSPYSWVCSNLAGEFQYGTFSVFVNAAVIVIWQFALTFAQQAAALSIVHLFALAMGGYMLARGRRLSAAASMMVALVAALNGWIICWGATDWFGALAAFAWLPWSWWALEKAMAKDGPRWRVLLPGPFIYLLIAGGFPYTVIMLGLITAWLGLRALLQRRDWPALVRLSIGWFIGLGLSAPAWMALLDYAPGSRRSLETFLPRQWLVPLTGLPGLILPGWTVSWRQFEGLLQGHPALELACGVAPIVIVVAAVARRRLRFISRLRGELGLLLVVLCLCLIPSAGIFRFSFRWLPLFHLLLALIAAEASRRWNEDDDQAPQRTFENLGAWAVLLTGSTWAAMAAFGLTNQTSAFNLPLVSFAICLAWWLGYAWLPRKLSSWLPPLVTFATLLATYLAIYPHPTTARYFFTDDLRVSAPLDSERLYLSLYPAPQSWYRDDMTGAPYGAVVRPGSTAMFGALHLINGYSPVSPAGIARLLDFGTHGQINPARFRDVVLQEAGNEGLLAQLGIDGLIFAREFWEPYTLPAEWKMVRSDAEGDVFHRVPALPKVRALPNEQFADASLQIAENSRQKVIVNVTPVDRARPVLIAFARPFFQGYIARLNGRPVEVTSLRGLVPTVQIPAGAKGRLELIYRPRAVTVGGSASALTLVAMVAAFFWMQRGR